MTALKVIQNSSTLDTDAEIATFFGRHHPPSDGCGVVAGQRRMIRPRFYGIAMPYGPIVNQRPNLALTQF
jgi:hypothetical protein